MKGTSCWISEEGPAVSAAIKLPAAPSADITSWRVQSSPAISTKPEMVPSPSRPGMRYRKNWDEIPYVKQSMIFAEQLNNLHKRR